MRLIDKKVVMLVSDGVELGEYELLRRGFESEGATVFVTAPQDFLTVESVDGTKRGRDILIDLPFEAVVEQQFDGVIIPDGLLSTEELQKNKDVLELLYTFHLRGKPLFASGTAREILYESNVLSEQVLVREGTAMSEFIDRAVGILLDSPSMSNRYRPSTL